MYILVAQWKDIEGTKLVKYLGFDRSEDLGDDSLLKYLTDGYGFGSARRIPSGLIYQKTSDNGDGAYYVGEFVGMNNPTLYSDWYYENRDLFENKTLIEEWSRSGIIKNEDSEGRPTIPVFISGVNSL